MTEPSLPLIAPPDTSELERRLAESDRARASLQSDINRLEKHFSEVSAAQQQSIEQQATEIAADMARRDGEIEAAIARISDLGSVPMLAREVNAEINRERLQKAVDTQDRIQLDAGFAKLSGTIETPVAEVAQCFRGNGLPYFSKFRGAILCVDFANRPEVQAIWRDNGRGNHYQGLGFCGLPKWNAYPAPPTGIGYHLTPNNGIDTGHPYFNSCGFGGLQVGILCGRNMDKAFEEAEEYEGWRDNHADHLRVEHSHFHNVGTCFYLRNEQSCAHVVTDISAVNTDCIWYIERGGELTATGVMVGGARKCVLRLGRQSGKNVFNSSIRALGLDGSGAKDFRILDMDDGWVTGGPLTGQNITFDGISMDWSSDRQQVDNPLFVVKGSTTLVVKNAGILGPRSLRLQANKGGSKVYGQPTAIFENALLVGCQTPEDFIDWEGSTIGSEAFRVRFINCRAYDSPVRWFDDVTIKGVRGEAK